MKLLNESLEKDEIDIHASDNTVDNCYDVILENEDYTIGNILNSELYTIFYNDLKILDYIGFKKMHPHDSDSILRLSLTDKTKGISTIKTILKSSVEGSIKTLEGIKGGFDGSR
uniref:DNA-directed RNA polymerase RBP11-like dimerisation domain-containing protein n=1 Tax=viral metagenome TaxID=1070528 RepID=A0A6C0KQJ2_9ZZZZ